MHFEKQIFNCPFTKLPNSLLFYENVEGEGCPSFFIQQFINTVAIKEKKNARKKLSDFHRSNLELERSYLLLKHARYNKCILYNYVSFLKWTINHVEIEINVKRYLE